MNISEATLDRVLEALRIASDLNANPCGAESGRVSGKAMIAKIHLEVEMGMANEKIREAV